MRTAFKFCRPFLRQKSERLLEQSSLRSKVENFSYCFKNAFFQSSKNLSENAQASLRTIRWIMAILIQASLVRGSIS